MRSWKTSERRVAEMLGGVRVPVTGRCRGDAPDVLHSDLSIEVKSRKKLPGWIVDEMEQAKAAATDGQLPVVVLHEGGARYKDALVLVRLGDFAQPSAS